MVIMVTRASGKAASSENLLVAYACFVTILKHSPPAIYHGQDSARGGHTGSILGAMFKSDEKHTFAG